MKQWIILILSIVIVIASGLWEIKYLEDTSRYALTDINYSRNLIQNSNFDMAKEQVNDISNTWDNIKTVWSIFVDHEEIGSIEEGITTYKSYVELEASDEAIAAANELERIFKHVVDKQKLHVGNII